MPYGKIVATQADVGDTDVQRIDGEGDWPCLSEGVLLCLDQPSIEEVHHRIMYHIKRVGEVAYKLTDLRRATISRSAGSSYPNQDREDHEDATQLKDTVEANGVISLDIRYMKERNQYYRTDPESPPE